MKISILSILKCPATGSRLVLENEEMSADRVVSGTLVSATGRYRYPVVDSIPRFVQAENYAENFGLQWRVYRKTQLDSESGLPISAERFYRFTGWTPKDLLGKRVLDVGCGAGRFTEIALAAGAEVVALDYSMAVEACWANHRDNRALTVVQADVYHLPFEDSSFDFIYCLGVLQHTPDVRRAFLALPPKLKPNGRLAVDVYPRLRGNILWSKYWLRPLTKRMRTDQLFKGVQKLTPQLLRVSNALRRIPLVGAKLKYLVPVANYEGVYALSPEQMKEWAVLDTFDMLSPAFDQPQTAATLRHWFSEAHLTDVTIERIGFLVGRGRKEV